MRDIPQARRPRVCVVVHAAYPLGRPRAVRQALAAVDGGYQVDVVALRRRHESRCEDLDSVRVHRLPLSHRQGAGVGRSLVEYTAFTVFASFFVACLALRRRFSVVVVHNPPDFLLIAGVVPKWFGARLVFDVQDRAGDMFDMRFGNRRGATLIGRALLDIERLALRLADEVVTVHEPYRRELVRQAPRSSVHTVLNSVDERLLPRPDHRDGEESFRIVYHGSLTPPYGVNLLIAALPLLQDAVADWRLEIYGDGDCLPFLREEAERRGLANRVLLSGGFLPLSEVLNRVVGASVGVIPNLKSRLNDFALPGKLFEYVALRVPVVAADLPTIREYFSSRELTFFAPGNEDELADALRAVALDKDRAAERADRAFARYQCYRWPQNAERYRSILTPRTDQPRTLVPGRRLPRRLWQG